MRKQVGFTTCARYRSLEDLQRDSSDLYLGYCGMERCAPGHSFGPAERALYVIHFVSSGKGRFRSEDKEYCIGQGEAFLISPGKNIYYEADMNEPWEYWWVAFQGVKAYEYVVGMGFDRYTPVIRVEKTEQIFRHINNILDAHQLTAANELRRKSELLQLIACVMEENEERLNAAKCNDCSGTIYVKRVVEYLSTHYNEKIRINELADLIGINRCYLTNIFKKQFGVSPQEYLVKLRMDQAASLICNTGLTVSEVAARVGYEDPLAFSKIFRQKYGVSPKKWREIEEVLVECDEIGYVNQQCL